MRLPWQRRSPAPEPPVEIGTSESLGMRFLSSKTGSLEDDVKEGVGVVLARHAVVERAYLVFAQYLKTGEFATVLGIRLEPGAPVTNLLAEIGQLFTTLAGRGTYLDVVPLDAITEHAIAAVAAPFYDRGASA